MSARHDADFRVRVPLFAGWIAGLIGVVGVGRQPFTSFMIGGGVLIVVAGALMLSDGGAAMARLNERYAPWQGGPSYKFTGSLALRRRGRAAPASS